MVAAASAFQAGGFFPSTAVSRSNVQLRPAQRSAPRVAARNGLAVKMGFDIEGLNQQMKDKRLVHLEEQAMEALTASVENDLGPAVFPNAMIVGDCIITHLLGKLGYLENGKAKIMVVDTFHLFDDTLPFLSELETKYKFKAEVFQAEGCKDKAEYDKKFGADLWQVDVEQYDKVCKVEPFQRGLKTLKTGVMINGRTRWQGNERAYINLYENAPIGGGMAKCNPLAYWTLEDCFDYAAKHKVPLHPSVERGYPSHGDKKDTIPIPEDGSVKFDLKSYSFSGKKEAWLDYASERKGRFVGLKNKDGSTKTECGIHVAGAEKTFDRDLWEAGKSKVKELSKSDAEATAKGGKPTLLVTYAPWCQFCQGMEEEFEQFAAQYGDKIEIAKYRGDEDREFVKTNLLAEAFPTITLIDKDGSKKKMDSNPDNRKVAEFKTFAGL